eukprot:gene1934-3754_t
MDTAVFVKMQFLNALRLSLKNKYLLANIVYVIYTSVMITIDYADLTITTVNKLYFLFGMVLRYLAYYYQQFLINAYLHSSLYGKEHPDGHPELFTKQFFQIRILELISSIIEMIAAIGWCLTWYSEYLENYGRQPYPTPSRGWTFDDPDMLANITILAAAMRECEWFWFMPVWGRWVPIHELKQQLHNLHIRNSTTSSSSESESININYVQYYQKTEGIIDEHVLFRDVEQSLK